MNPEKGPPRFPRGYRPPVRLPTIEPPGFPPEILRQLGNSPPLRRSPRPPAPLGPLRTTTPEAIDRALAAVARGEAKDLPVNGPALPIRLAPAVREVIEHSGLGRTEMLYLHNQLVEVLGNPETVAGLPRWRERPDCALRQIVFSYRDAVHVFTFVVAASVEVAVLVLAAEHYRRSTT